MHDAAGILLFAWFLLTVKQATALPESLCCAVRDTFLEDILIASSRHRCAQDHLNLPDKYEPTYECHPERCRVAPLTPPHHLLDCINAVPKPTEPPQINIPEDSPVHLRAAAAWRSNKPPAHNVTVVSTLSLDRLPQLLAQCRSWPGPLSAAVYMVMPPEEDAPGAVRRLTCVIRHLTKLMRYAEDDPQVCALDMVLLYEHKAVDLALRAFPVNTLRNIARIQARTDLLALMDVDFLMSRGFSNTLLLDDPYARMLNIIRNKGVIVIPAFDFPPIVSGRSKDYAGFALRAEQLAAASKTDVVQSYQAQELAQFSDFVAGHSATMYGRWLSANDTYNITYTEGYEPYVVVHRIMAPWHDSRFRGYDMNKIEHLAHLNWTGYTFIVHPTAYTIHRAHEPSAAKVHHDRDAAHFTEMAANKDAPKVSSLFLAHALFDSAKAAMAQGTFVPVIDDYTMSCLRTLPWWPSGPGEG